MELLNRAALIVTPKRRFLEWVNRLPDAGRPLTIDEARSLRMVYLAATGDDDLPLGELIDIYWEEIFDDSLDGWTHDESLWPVNRTPHVFRDWFDVDCIDGVADADPDEPVTILELSRTSCAVCGADLAADATAVVSRVDRSLQRMSVREVDAREEADVRDEGETHIDDQAQPVMVFRCCGESCATKMESALSAGGEE